MKNKNGAAFLSLCFIVTVVVTTILLSSKPSQANYLKGPGCGNNGCHVNAYTSTTFNAAINVGGTPSNYDLGTPPVVDVPQGGTFELDWYFSGLAGSNDATTGVYIELPQGWAVTNGTTGSVPTSEPWLSGWITTWWDNANANVAWDGTPVTATYAPTATHQGYRLNYDAAGTNWNTNGEGVVVNDTGSNTGLSDSDGANQLLGTDATISVPGSATLNSQHDIYIFGVGYNGNSKAYSQAIVKVRVVAGSANNAPVFTSSTTASYAENGTVVAKAITATDSDSDPVTFSIVGGTDQGDFSLQNASPGTGTASVELVFNTSPNFEAPTDSDTNNTYQVIVRASDGTATTDQTITITVTNVDEPPVAVNDNDSTTQDTTKDPTVNVLANDSDPEGAGLSITLYDNPSANNGTVVYNNDGTFSYTPDTGFSGPDTFTYTVSDGGLTSVGTVTINVGANATPNVPSSLAQHHTAGAGGAEVTKGAYTNETTIEFKATVSDTDGGNVTLEVEVKPLAIAFNGTIDCSNTVTSGSTATASCTTHSGGTAFADGQQLKWRARANDGSAQSAWVEY